MKKTDEIYAFHEYLDFNHSTNKFRQSVQTNSGDIQK